MCANYPLEMPEPLVDRNGRIVGYDTPMGLVMLARAEAASAAQSPSAPAAQSEVAAAPAEPAAEAETSTPPPREMTKEEAIVALCRAAKGTDDPSLLRAICLGCKALAREGIHKRRNKASRAARGKEAV